MRVWRRCTRAVDQSEGLRGVWLELESVVFEMFLSTGPLYCIFQNLDTVQEVDLGLYRRYEFITIKSRKLLTFCAFLIGKFYQEDLRDILRSKEPAEDGFHFTLGGGNPGSPTCRFNYNRAGKENWRQQVITQRLPGAYRL
ncbi:Uncharacterized protein DAT39_009790 [Clarias magur]|uniref:Uncharacterized protein n=1 Tax=Clarias magur TaxID=1594786 RepID=A0A8J4UQV4_CLAMG|nr:Uncharacterized protein DAT39_009790 [Clarias magur]